MDGEIRSVDVFGVESGPPEFARQIDEATHSASERGLMPKTKGARGQRGIPGPPGPAGPRGEVGAGSRGSTGASSRFPRSEAVEVSEHIDGIYNELEVQMKRMGQIQQQVDELRAKVKRLLFENSD